jgi:hypothetical protein
MGDSRDLSFIVSHVFRASLGVMVRAVLESLTCILDILARSGHRVTGAKKRCGAQQCKQGEGQHRHSLAHGNILWLSHFEKHWWYFT